MLSMFMSCYIHNKKSMLTANGMNPVDLKENEKSARKI